MNKRGLAIALALTLCVAAGLPNGSAKADAAAIDAPLIARIKNVVNTLAPTGGTTWEAYLNQRFYIATKLDRAKPTLNCSTDNSVAAGWKWTGVAASGAKATSAAKPASPLAIPYYNATTSTYYIWSGEQLRYALEACSQKPLTYQDHNLSLQADIDLNGQDGKVWACINELWNTTILGNGYTIYNLRVDDSNESRIAPNTNPNLYAAFIGKAVGVSMEHITFSYPNICGDHS